MKKIAFLLSLIIFITACPQSRISSGYRFRGLTKAQKVKNNIQRAKRNKKFQQIWEKILSSNW